MSWYIEVLKKYFVFSGRARRSEYWYFVLFNFLISIALTAADFALGNIDLETGGTGLISTIYSLAVLIPGLAVSVRRLHDTDRTGWWLLIAFIPVIGAIALLVFFFQDSQQGNNQYGDYPK